MNGAVLSTGIVRALSIRSPTRWAWFGRRKDSLPKAVERALTPADARAVMIEQIKRHLYLHFYVVGGALVRDDLIRDRTYDDGGLGESLAVEFADEVSWSGGWEVVSATSHGFLVRSGGLQIEAPLDACRSPGEIGAGSSIAVRLPAVARNLSPGFVLIRGRRDLDWGAGVRIYWHANRHSALPLTRAIVGELNESGIPFRYKVLDRLGRDSRCDSAVLYLRAGDWPEVRPRIERLHGEFASSLDPGVPAMTKPLAPGLGLAEDPPGGESFGQTRCGQIAEGLVRGFEAGAVTDRDRLDVLLDTFQKAGLDPDRLYLNPNSACEYEFTAVQSIVRTQNSLPLDLLKKEEASGYFDAAKEIAADICARAWWAGENCTWIGAIPTTAADGHWPGSETARSLGADLYSGSSGVALFLGEMAAVTADGTDLMRTARGALSHAIQTLKRSPDIKSYSLHGGTLGVALAASRIGVLSGDRSLVSYANAVACAAAEGLQRSDQFDVMAGKAGGVLGLLTIARISKNQDLVGRAMALGDQLLASGNRVRARLSWSDPAGGHARPLTGYSHGAAGGGHALTELYSETNHRRYRDGAIAAFEYERHCFDRKQRNWPDFRIEPGQPRPKKGEYPCHVMWCHGAPGILISRLRAWEIFADATSRDEAAIAAKSIIEWLASATTANQHSNFSLCHGIGGNAWALAEFATRTADELAFEAVRLAADTGLSRHGRAADWPCGVGVGMTPAYMVGRAGTGAFYLRLARPEIPSAFLLYPPTFG